MIGPPATRRPRQTIGRTISGGLFGLLTLASTPAGAQGRLRVIEDQTPIWRPGFFSAAAIVDAGTELDVLGRQGDWYEVHVPSTPGEPVDRGFVASSRVEPIGSERAVSARRNRNPRGLGRRPPVPQASGVAGFGKVTLEQFAASRAFSAVTGSPHGVWLGGGLQYRASTGLFASASLSRYSKVGERVATFEGVVYPLGVANRLTIIDYEAVAGLRRPVGTFYWYGGGGVGLYRAVEGPEGVGTTPEDSVSSSHTSFSVLGGIEKRIRPSIGVAFEGGWSVVPLAKASGAIGDLKESGLGGVRGGVKVILGR